MVPTFALTAPRPDSAASMSCTEQPDHFLGVVLDLRQLRFAADRRQRRQRARAARGDEFLRAGGTDAATRARKSRAGDSFDIVILLPGRQSLRLAADYTPAMKDVRRLLFLLALATRCRQSPAAATRARWCTPTRPLDPAAKAERAWAWPSARCTAPATIFVLLDLRGGRGRARCRQRARDRRPPHRRGLATSCWASPTPAAPAAPPATASGTATAAARSNAATARAASPPGWCRAGAARAPRFTLDSPAGPIEVECLPDGRYALDMGTPRLPARARALRAVEERLRYEWRARECTLRFGAASMGNPHALVEVEDVARAPVAAQATGCSTAGCSAGLVNVGFAQVLAPDAIRLRVVERGVGETLACGTAGRLRSGGDPGAAGRVGRQVDVQLPGARCASTGAGWRQRAQGGPAAFVFEGEWGAWTEEYEGAPRRARGRRLAATPPQVQGQFPDLALSLVAAARRRPAASQSSYQLEVLRVQEPRVEQAHGRPVRQRQGHESLAVRTHQLALALMRARAPPRQ